MNENKPLLWGFLRSRKCVLPTRRGWLALLTICAIVMFFAIRNAYDFLAMNAPMPGGILVVEGWGPDFFMNDVVKEYRANHYDGIYVTGGPIETGATFTKFRTYAEMGAATLENMGVDPAALHSVPAVEVAKDRTYASAIALKKWLAEHDVHAGAITIITVGPHARRSHLLFEKAFGGSANIGVISVRDESLAASAWWTNSIGFRSVTDEMIAYIYARFLFHAPGE